MKLNLYIAVFFFNYTTPKDFYYVVNDGIYSMGMLLKNGLSRIFHENNGRYGFRRIQAALRNEGSIVNHKKIIRVMKKLGLKTVIRKEKYKSYR